MRYHRTRRMAAATLSLLVVAACSSDPPVPEEPPAPALKAVAEMTPAELQTEYSGIHQRLGDLRARALADSALRTAFEGLQASVEAAMEEADPEAPARRERMETIPVELQDAQVAGDTARVNSLLEEGSVLQTAIQANHSQALAREDVALQLNAVQDRVVKRMTELDPEVPALLARANEIAARLQAGGG